MASFIGATILPPIFNCSFHATGSSCPEAAEIILSKGALFGHPVGGVERMKFHDSPFYEAVFSHIFPAKAINSGINSAASTLARPSPPETIGLATPSANPNRNQLQESCCRLGAGAIPT